MIEVAFPAFFLACAILTVAGIFTWVTTFASLADNDARTAQATLIAAVVVTAVLAALTFGAVLAPEKSAPDAHPIPEQEGEGS